MIPSFHTWENKWIRKPSTETANKDQVSESPSKLFLTPIPSMVLGTESRALLTVNTPLPLSYTPSSPKEFKKKKY